MKPSDLDNGYTEVLVMWQETVRNFRDVIHCGTHARNARSARNAHRLHSKPKLDVAI